MNVFQLKVIATIFMFLDHIRYFFPFNTSLILHLFSRHVLGIFAFLSTESFHHTSSKEGYLKRLYLSSLFIYIGNFIINNIILTKPKFLATNNVIISIALAVSILYLNEKIDQLKINGVNKYFKKILKFFIYLLFLGIGSRTEGGVRVILISNIYYYFFKYNKNTKKSEALNKVSFIFIGLFMLSLLLIFSGRSLYTREEFLTSLVETFVYPFTLIFICLYNGELGRSSKNIQKFFYYFYPIHIWMITIVLNLI